MRNRTVYQVLEETMEDYSYSIKKTGRVVEIKGSVFIPKIEIEITHEKEIHLGSSENSYVCGESRLIEAIKCFKNELRDKVAKVIEENKSLLTDDDEMIQKLQSDIKELKKELEKAKEEIAKLEIEKLGTNPYIPYTPWTSPNPWSTGITWGDGTGDNPNPFPNTITCKMNDYPNERSSITTEEGLRMNRGSKTYTSDTKRNQKKQDYHEDTVHTRFCSESNNIEGD